MYSFQLPYFQKLVAFNESEYVACRYVLSGYDLIYIYLYFQACQKRCSFELMLCLIVIHSLLSLVPFVFYIVSIVKDTSEPPVCLGPSQPAYGIASGFSP